MPLIRPFFIRRVRRPRRRHTRRLQARRLLLATSLIALALTPNFFRGAVPANSPEGARLLQTQLPTGTPLRQAGCERLVRAVRAATLAHHREAAAILSAALKADGVRPGAERRSCECVVQLFRAAVIAAPDHANVLLETAEADCPECADALSAMLARLGDKNVVADPKDFAGSPGRDGRDLSDRNLQGLGYSPSDGVNPGTGAGVDSGTGFGPGLGMGPGNAGTDGGGFNMGFGGGLGAGFPGAPGFGGSTPGGGFALPQPIPVQVTAVVNN